MTKQEIIERLRDDEAYYGEFGQQFISASMVGELLRNPRGFKDRERVEAVPLVVGGYFHTYILEPEKIGNYKIIDANTRTTKKYKEESEGKICLLRKEQEKIHQMKEQLWKCDVARDLITGCGQPDMVTYEEPGYGEIGGLQFKGKADIINHMENCIVDIKTTSDINKFRFSAKRYNYDAQAYIYQKLFGLDMVFVVIDKDTFNIGIFTCTEQFVQGGAYKVKNAIENYKLIDGPDAIDLNQYFISEAL